jgi:ectoine hydroxylase-related dioxygenase (phytanoyl-CoA dioxygenase family)
MYRLFEIDLQCFTNCGKQAQHLVSLHRLSLDDRIIEVLHELGLGFPNISTRPVLYFNAERLAKKEVYWRLSAHQDWRSMQGSLDAVVVWIPVVDVDRSLGALEVIPGSHRWGLLESDLVDGYGKVKEPLPTSNVVPVEVERGDALFFSAFLVHRSGTNVTDAIRWSCHFRYNNLQEKTFIQRGFPHPYIYRPRAELISPDFPSASAVAEAFD